MITLQKTVLYRQTFFPIGSGFLQKCYWLSDLFSSKLLTSWQTDNSFSAPLGHPRFLMTGGGLRLSKSKLGILYIEHTPTCIHYSQTWGLGCRSTALMYTVL